MKLIVFETDMLEKEYVLQNDIPADVNTGSVMRGAGSIRNTLDGNQVYDTVLFVKKDYFSGDYVGFSTRLNHFLKDLRGYGMINQSTKLI